MTFDYVVYKITFPNGKIYIGSDTQSGGHNINYFGSWLGKLVEKDFTKKQLQNFSIRKEIIYESVNKADVRNKEIELIIKFHSNNPSVGYNQTHKNNKINKKEF